MRHLVPEKAEQLKIIEEISEKASFQVEKERIWGAINFKTYLNDFRVPAVMRMIESRNFY